MDPSSILGSSTCQIIEPYPDVTPVFYIPVRRLVLYFSQTVPSLSLSILMFDLQIDADTFGMFFCFLAGTTDLATPLGCLTLSAVQFLNDDACTALGASHRLTAPTPITIFCSALVFFPNMLIPDTIHQRVIDQRWCVWLIPREVGLRR